MSLGTLRERLVQQLAPIDGWSHDLPPRRSDFDLNPDLTRPMRELRPAAVLIAVIARPDGATVLMTRRADTLTSHTGQIAFPGGRLDADETALQAALRDDAHALGQRTRHVLCELAPDGCAEEQRIAVLPLIRRLVEDA